MRLSVGLLALGFTVALVSGCVCTRAPYNPFPDSGTGGPENCSNGYDDDGDAFADCADSECFGMGNCVDPCIADPTLPGCAKPDPGAKFGVGGNVGGWMDETPPACDPASSFYILPPPDFVGSSTVITGGSGLYSGSVAGGTLTRIVMSFVELAGFYEVPLAGTDFTFTVSFAQDLLLTNVTMVLIPYGLDGAVGRCFTFPINIMQVGGGDLQVSLVFNMPDDLDLHLVEPGGFEIYYGATVSPSGGNLDLDSNAACFQDYINNENITYVGVTPPTGTYTVRVGYWADCAFGSGPVSYVVTVTKGGVATTYPGTFGDGTDTGGGAGSGTTVATFVYP